MSHTELNVGGPQSIGQKKKTYPIMITKKLTLPGLNNTEYVVGEILKISGFNYMYFNIFCHNDVNMCKK